MATKRLREPINAITHLAGAGAFLIGAIVLVLQRILVGAPLRDLISGAIFGLSLVLLYLASGIYHGYNGREKGIAFLKKLDHSMIYVLIAGTYTPVLLSLMSGNKRIVLLSVVWGIALLGILIKVFVKGIPRPVYTSFYLLMGWMLVFFFQDVYAGVAPSGFLLLALGGLLYSIGGVIYALKRPNLSKRWGFHELFHLFILGGSLSHYFFVFFYI